MCVTSCNKGSNKANDTDSPKSTLKFRRFAAASRLAPPPRPPPELETAPHASSSAGLPRPKETATREEQAQTMLNNAFLEQYNGSNSRLGR